MFSLVDGFAGEVEVLEVDDETTGSFGVVFVSCFLMVFSVFPSPLLTAAGKGTDLSRAN